MTAYEFDPSSVDVAQRDIVAALVHLLDVVERPLRRMDLPEMPASVRGLATSTIAESIGTMSRARVSLAELSKNLKRTAYELEHPDRGPGGLLGLGGAVVGAAQALGHAGGAAWQSPLLQYPLGLVGVADAAEQVVDRARAAPGVLRAAAYAETALRGEARQMAERWERIMRTGAEYQLRKFSAETQALAETAARAGNRLEKVSDWAARAARAERLWGVLGGWGSRAAKLPGMRVAVSASRYRGVGKGLTVLDVALTAKGQYDHTPFDKDSGWTAADVALGAGTHVHPVVSFTDTVSGGAFSHGTVEGTLVAANFWATGDDTAAANWVADRKEDGGAYGHVVGWADHWATNQEDWGVFEGDGSVQWNPTKWHPSHVHLW